MRDEQWFVYGGAMVFVGVVAMITGHDLGVGLIGLGVIGPVILLFLDRVETQKEDRAHYYQRIEERLNDVEVWREETAPEVQFLRDRITNLEQKERAMGEYHQLVSSCPLIGGLIIAAVYFIVRGAKKHGDR